MGELSGHLRQPFLACYWLITPAGEGGRLGARAEQAQLSHDYQGAIRQRPGPSHYLRVGTLLQSGTSLSPRRLPSPSPTRFARGRPGGPGPGPVPVPVPGLLKSGMLPRPRPRFAGGGPEDAPPSPIPVAGRPGVTVCAPSCSWASSALQSTISTPGGANRRAQVEYDSIKSFRDFQVRGRLRDSESRLGT